MKKGRFLVVLVVLAACGLLVGAFAGRILEPRRAFAQEDVPDVMSGYSIAITDDAGNPKILMATDENGGAPGMALHDSDGTVRAVYSLSGADEPAIVLNNTKGDMRFVMAVTDAGGPGVLIKDKAGKNVFRAPAAK